MMKLAAYAAAAALALGPTVAAAADHAMGAAAVMAENQSVANGVVSATKVVAPANGWLVVHRTDGAKPGPVVGYAPLRAGANTDVAAILTEPVQPGEMLMLMVHGEEGGMKTGAFEYTLGAKEDGPIRKDGALVMKVVTAE